MENMDTVQNALRSFERPNRHMVNERLEPYRKDIEEAVRRGATPANIHKILSENGINESRSSIYRVLRHWGLMSFNNLGLLEDNISYLQGALEGGMSAYALWHEMQERGYRGTQVTFNNHLEKLGLRKRLSGQGRRARTIPPQTAGPSLPSQTAEPSNSEKDG